MKWIDLPPVWLFVCLLLTWLSPWRLPVQGLVVPGLVLIAVGAALTIAALKEFKKAETTVVPHQSPDALITEGIYRWTRNPIYLADILVLLGFALMWGKVLGLLLVPLFMWILDRRFIRGEEERLRTAFGAAFEAYAEKTRRWI